MTLLERLGTTGPAVGTVVVSTVLVYALVVLLTRLSGPRSLATMSSFDFAATVAVGSLLASTAVGSTSLSDGAAGLVVLFGAQAVIGVLRRRDLSVLRQEQGLDDELLEGVRGAELLG